MKLDLVIFENGKIPEISKPIEKFDNDLVKITNAMFDVVHRHNGIGLAAIQIGVPKRIIVVDTGSNKLVAINPEITWSSDETDEYNEGSLSIQNLRVNVRRPIRIKIKYQNLSGVEKNLEAEGLFGRCIQHEIEQMDGKSIADYF